MTNETDRDSEPHNRPGKLCGPDLIRGTNISRTTFREVDAEYLERSVSWHYRGLLRANGSCWTVVERLEVLPLLWVSGKGNLVARLRASSRTRVYIEHYLILSYLILSPLLTKRSSCVDILNFHARVFIPRSFRNLIFEFWAGEKFLSLKLIRKLIHWERQFRFRSQEWKG